MEESKNLPNFLIVGAAKSATTSIHEYLNQHPDIFMSKRKEPCFFTFKGQQNIRYANGRDPQFISDIQEYEMLFKDEEKKKIRGESSTPYLYFYQKTIENIKATISKSEDVKILIILRNPIERAYSQYMHKVRDLVEHESFYTALQLEKNRMENNHHFDFFYADRGLYYESVKSYLANFKNVKIIFHEDISSNWLSSLNEITDFLKLPRYKFQKIKSKNVSGFSRFPFITKLVKENFIGKKIIGKIIGNNFKKMIVDNIKSMNLKKAEPMDEKSRLFLNNFYREDIKSLEQIVNRDLSSWYK